MVMGGVEWTRDDSRIWLTKGRMHVSTIHSPSIWQFYGAVTTSKNAFGKLARHSKRNKSEQKRCSADPRNPVVPKTI